MPHNGEAGGMDSDGHTTFLSSVVVSSSNGVSVDEAASSGVEGNGLEALVMFCSR